MERYVDIRSPYTGGKVKEVCTTEVMEYQGRTYTVPVRFYQCVDTGETFSTTEQDQEWYEALHDLADADHCDIVAEDTPADRSI